MNVGIPRRSAGRSARNVADLGQSRRALVRQHACERAAVAHQVRAVGIGREVHVGEREHAAGGRPGEDATRRAPGRVDRRGKRETTCSRSLQYGQPSAWRILRVFLGLLQADDVRARALDRADHAARVDDIAAEPDVERHHPHLGRRLACAGAAAASSTTTSNATTRPTLRTLSSWAMADHPRILLFDIDGTLVATGGAGAVAWRQAFEELTASPPTSESSPTRG